MTLMEQAVAEQLAGVAPPLHLPDLYIEGFRGIDELTIPRLGRVTLLAGENGVGKTTALEAVRAYAAVGEPYFLAATLLNRNEVTGEVLVTISSGGAPVQAGEMHRRRLDDVLPDWKSLFNEGYASRIEIGRIKSPRLIIENDVLPNEVILGHLSPIQVIEGSLYQPVMPSTLKITLKGGGTDESVATDPTYTVVLTPSHGYLYEQRSYGDESKLPLTQAKVDCILVPSAAGQIDGLYEMWERVIENGDEERVVKALIIVDEEIADIHVTGFMRAGVFRAMAKLTSGRGRVPLHGRGEGAVRVFEIATCLVTSANGFLLIDEAGTGLHYTVQRDFWRMVLQTAQANNVQVLATTHSADCIRGFAEAANENPEISSAYYRMERDKKGLYVVGYPQNSLFTATRNRTETR